LNETVFVNGTIERKIGPISNARVDLYFYNTSAGPSSAIYWATTYTDNQGRYSFNWYNATKGNFTLQVRYVTSTGYYVANSTTVKLIEPITINDMTPNWYYDRASYNRNYYEQILNITSNTYINDIKFNNANSYLQPYYRNELHGAYSNCKNLSPNNYCLATYRYSDLPKGSTSVTVRYTVNYTRGNFYSSSYSSVINVFDAVKDVGYGVIESPIESIAWPTNITYTGTGSCIGCDHRATDTGNLYSVTWGRKTFKFSFNVSDYHWAIAEVILGVTSSISGVSFSTEANVYIDGVLQSQKIVQMACTCMAWSGNDCVNKHYGVGGRMIYKISPGYHTIEVNISQYLPNSLCVDATVPNITALVKVYFFNKTNYEEVNYSGSFSDTSLLTKYFSEDNKFFIAKNTYFFAGLQSSVGGTVGFSAKTSINNVESYSAGINAYYTVFPTYTQIFNFSQNAYISGTNNISTIATNCYTYTGSPATGCSANIINGYLYIPKNDYIIQITDISNQYMENQRDIQPIRLWLGKNHTVTVKVKNISPFNQTPTVSLITPPHVMSYPAAINLSLSPNEEKELKFNISVLNLETSRGFGLDTLWVVAKDPNGTGTFGYNYISRIRTLPPKDVQVTLKVPERVQAGGLFSVYTTFTPMNYSIFYPHIMLDLDGTFGFEVGT
ncbi:MAG: hypothetical protein NDF51_05175, partial [archaeon YNP-WB-040]|nr:hypothetical protein [Candidatus Culexarchaeum yellowstonense]